MKHDLLRFRQSHRRVAIQGAVRSQQLCLDSSENIKRSCDMLPRPECQSALPDGSSLQPRLDPKLQVETPERLVATTCSKLQLFALPNNVQPTLKTNQALLQEVVESSRSRGRTLLKRVLVDLHVSDGRTVQLNRVKVVKEGKPTGDALCKLSPVSNLTGTRPHFLMA